jgi:AcrR family transcriptional regulator
MALTTKDKILDTAERLFAEQGYDATSLRQIIAAAAVNLAAVHYHFHSKEELLDAVILRKVTPVNEERTALLDRFEREAGDSAPPVEQVLEAFIAPAFGARERSPQFVKLMGRVHAEGIMLRLMTEHFQPLLRRFLDAFQRALPDVDREELLWRIHFMVGAMAHTLRSRPEIHQAAGVKANFGADQISRSLIDFLAAGFRVSWGATSAPAPAGPSPSKTPAVLPEKAPAAVLQEK